MSSIKSGFSRRALLKMGLSISPLWLAACTAVRINAPTASMPTEAPVELPTITPEAAEAAVTLAATPSCDDGDEPTPAQTEGPYFTPNSPERTNFREAGIVGTEIAVSGYVLTTACQPVAQALLDFWHCDDAGNYDNVGYRLRGHFYSDDNGYYRLETIVPGLYPGRTRHFHVKVQAPNEPILTTQLYFPSEPSNERDSIFRPECLLAVQEEAAGLSGTFNFVLDI